MVSRAIGTTSEKPREDYVGMNNCFRNVSVPSYAGRPMEGKSPENRWSSDFAAGL